MTLRKNAAGIYEADYRFKGLPRLHLSLRTTKKAEATERYVAMRRVVREGHAAVIADVRAGRDTVERVTLLVKEGKPIARLSANQGADSHWGTVDQVVTRYLAWLGSNQRSPRTVELAGYQCRRFQDFVFNGKRTGDTALDDVTRAHIQAYQTSMEAAPKNTVTTYMSRVQGIWTFAGLDEQDTAAEEKRATVPLYVPIKSGALVRETTARDRVLSAEEGKRLMAETPDRLHFLVGCGLLAGLRQGEALHLRPLLDVDVELGALTIQRQPTWRPKTKRSARTLPMSPALLALAKRHAESFASAAWMFPSPVHKDRPLTPDFVNKQLREIVERAGMEYGREKPKGVTFHTLRHSFASHAVSSGVDLYTVAKILGDSVATVETTYAKLSRDHKLAAMAQVAAAFMGTAE